jgi:hypothetical protein
MLKDLYPKKPRELSKYEEEELYKTIRYSNNKLYDTFNSAKSIWNMVFDAVEVSIKKNKENLGGGYGYVFYYRQLNDMIYVWEYQIKKSRGSTTSDKTILKKIYEDHPNETTLVSIIENNSSFKKNNYFREFPVFEMTCNQSFPMEQTVVPIMKRKIMSYIFQLVSSDKINNFDS